ncbi:MAG TPA: MBL fold metallo-hydrolase, partial [Acidimicrobiales bacterium]|nr:MBL fold metallo-hydrolase [Acidimicrobiales bacterium]
MSSPLSLTVLGCDGSFPGPGGAGSGYLLSCEGTNVWLDAGPGTLANIQRHIALEQIDAVVISHEHIDHWSDLEHLAVACKWVVRRPPVPLYCEADIPLMMRTSASDRFDRRAIGPDTRVVIGAMVFTFSRTEHSVDTLAVRVEGAGRSLGYSADSGPGWGLSRLGPGLDLALCEATFLSEGEGSLPHMSARQ